MKIFTVLYTFSTRVLGYNQNCLHMPLSFDTVYRITLYFVLLLRVCLKSTFHTKIDRRPELFYTCFQTMSPFSTEDQMIQEQIKTQAWWFIRIKSDNKYFCSFKLFSCYIHLVLSCADKSVRSQQDWACGEEKVPTLFSTKTAIGPSKKRNATLCASSWQYARSVAVSLNTEWTQFKIETLKLHDNNNTHKTYRDRCKTRHNEPLLTTWQGLDKPDCKACGTLYTSIKVCKSRHQFITIPWLI